MNHEQLVRVLSLAILLPICCSCRVHAQGYFAFRNFVPGLIDAPVFDTDCQTRLKGSAYLSQVYAGLSPDTLEPANGPIPFLGTGIGGYMEQAGGAVVPGVPDRTLVYAQLRAWEAAAGPTYEAAVAGGGKHGASNIVPVLAIYPPALPDWAVGIQSFCLVPEPTPSVLCYYSLAALAVWIRFARYGASRPARRLLPGNTQSPQSSGGCHPNSDVRRESFLSGGGQPD